MLSTIISIRSRSVHRRTTLSYLKTCTTTRRRTSMYAPWDQRMEFVGKGARESTNGYVSQVSYYGAKRCEGCPMRGQCHKAKGNRRIEVNHRLNELKAKARERLTSETGKYHRSKRPIEVEAVFGQMKSNNRFNRFSMRGLEKVDMEFALMCIAHIPEKMVEK